MRKNLIFVVGSLFVVSCGGKPTTPELRDLYFEVLPTIQDIAAEHGYERIDLSKPPAMELKIEPEMCCGYECAGPYHYVDKHQRLYIAARKAGCQLDNWLWVSQNWPPICNTASHGYEWDDEPHCVPEGTDRSSYVYEKTFVHEVMHWVGAHYGISDPTHTQTWTTEVEPDILRTLGYIE